MTQSKMYKRHRFPPEVIQYAVWLYHRFNLSHRAVEDLMAARGITVSYEAIRLWCNKFGSKYAQRLRRKHQGYGDTFFIDEMFVKIRGQQHHLWRAVDQDGEVVDVFLQKRRDGKAAQRFFKRLLLKHKGGPREIVTDKLRSYNVAHRELMLDTIHDTTQYANNRAELSYEPTSPRAHEPTSPREPGSGHAKFKSVEQAQRFLGAHAAVYNLFNLGRHFVSVENYRYFRQRAFASWEKAVAV
jgi:putative transposase